MFREKHASLVACRAAAEVGVRRVDPATEFRGRSLRLARVWVMPWALMVVLIISDWGPAVASQVESGRAAGPSSAAQGFESSARQDVTLQFRVVDARDKAPLRDVSIVVVVDVVARPISLTTEADGHLSVAIPKSATRFVGI